MAPSSVLVTGSSRGIGLGLVKEFLKNKDINHIIAGARKPAEAKDLQAIKDSRLHIIQLDVDNDDSIRAAFKQVDEIVGSQGLNLLVNNAGILLPYSTTGEIDRNTFNKNYNTNVTSITITTQIFLPLLRRASSLVKSDELSINRAAIVNISSTLGSIELNDSGSAGPMKFLAYRSTKSAVNQLNKSFSIDLAGDHILSVAFCPGWVQTDMGTSAAMLTVDQSVGSLVSAFAKLRKEDNGRFFDHKGNPQAF